MVKTVEEIIDQIYAKSDQNEIWIELLSLGDDQLTQISKKLEHDGQTILHALCSKNMLKLVKDSISRCGDVNVRDGGGNTLLMAAASGDQDSDGVVRYIMEARGVNFTLKNNEYLHAFSCAATKGNFNILETMLEFRGAYSFAIGDLQEARSAFTSRVQEVIDDASKPLSAADLGALDLDAGAGAGAGAGGGGSAAPAVLDHHDRERGETMDSVTLDTRMKNCLPPEVSYVETEVAQLSMVDKSYKFINIDNEEGDVENFFLSKEHKDNIVIVCNVANHYLLFFGRKEAADKRGVRKVSEFICFDPAQENEYHQIPQGFIDALNFSFGSEHEPVIITKSTSVIQPVESGGIISNNHCGRFVCFVAAGLSFNKIFLDEERRLNLIVGDEIYPIDQLSIEQSRLFGEILQREYLGFDYKDEEKEAAFDKVLQSFVDKVLAPKSVDKAAETSGVAAGGRVGARELKRATDDFLSAYPGLVKGGLLDYCSGEVRSPADFDDRDRAAAASASFAHAGDSFVLDGEEVVVGDEEEKGGEDEKTSGTLTDPEIKRLLDQEKPNKSARTDSPSHHS